MLGQNQSQRKRKRPTAKERQMAEQEEYAEASIRKFLTVLFTLRARRHLQKLADLLKTDEKLQKEALINGWSAEKLLESEALFIQPSNFVPTWVPDS